MADIKLVFDADTAPVDRAIRLLDNLEAEIRDVERAEKAGLITKKRATAETARLNTQITRLNTAAKGSAKDFRVFEKSIYGSGKALRQKEIAMQQAGYQLQDFIVQVQAGTNPLIAFSQQGSQLAGFFAGPWGAAIGLGIAALGGLGTALLGTKGKTKDLYDETEAFIDLMDGYQDAADSAGESATTLSESFGNLASTVREARDAILELRQAQLDQQMTDMFGQFREQYVQGGGGDRRRVLADLFGFKTTARGFKDPEGNLRGGQIGELMSFMTAAESAETNEERLKFLKMALTTAKELALVTGGFTEDEQALLSSIQNVYKAFEGAVEKTTKKASEAIGEVGLDAFGGAGRSQADIKAGLQILKDIGEEKKQQALFDSATKANEAAAENKLRVVREQANRAAVAYIKRRRDESILALGEEADKLISNANVSLELDKKSNEAKKQNMLDTMNYQFSLVEDTINQVEGEIDDLKESAEELGIRLGMGFDQAVSLIRRAKAEATIGLDAFGGAGDFKYSVPTTFTPDEKDKPKRKLTTIEDTIKAFQRQIETEKTLMTLTGQRRREEELFLDLKYANQDADIKTSETRLRGLAQEMAAMEERSRLIEEARQQQEDIADMIGSSFENAMMSIVDGTKSVEDAFKTMAAEVIKELYRVLVVQQMVNAAKSYFGFADGGVISKGNVVPYANGGVVGSPTYFPMAGGRTGLMGEAGPEAIMPLKRGKNGKLGVQVDGGQQQSVVVNQSFNFQANGDDSVKRIIAQQAPKIAQMTQQQIMDSRRRGGQMKAVFG